MHPINRAAPSGAAPAAVAFEIKLLIAALFWVGGYAILAVRATLTGDGSPPFFSEARLVATLAGAALLLGVMLLWEAVQGTAWPTRLALFAAALLAACAAMFVVRLATAQVFGLFGPTELADGANWLIAWAGYFLAAVTSFVAFAALRHADALGKIAVAEPEVAVSHDYECADDVYTMILDRRG
jgi:hypothetical protein